MGGATPTIVPFSLLGGAAGPGGRGAPGAAGPAGGGDAPAAGAGGCAPKAGGIGGALPPGWFIMSIVPLNFGAAAPFRLKLHFEHVGAVSGF